MHSAKLVWVTPDAEKLIGKIARVSNPKNEDNPDYEKLLKYLIKHKHWSPFEMASMCVEITTTRAIAPQILRHRSFSFQEFSQRYAVATATDIPQLRRQDTKISAELRPLNTVTRLYMSGTIRSWLHYVDLRGDNGTQAEHKLIARSIGEILDTELPTVSRAMWS